MNRPRLSGFTLIELMIALSVMALVLTLGVPSFQGVIQDNRMTTQINQFVGDFSLARSEALKRGVPVTLCKRNTAGNACDNSASWLAGWIVFVDGDGDGTIDGGEAVLRLHEPLQGLTKMNLSRNRVTFDSMGMTVGYTATISFCDSRGLTKAKGRVLSNTGRLRLAESGDALNCS